MLAPEFIGELVNRNALAHTLRPDVVACIILQESENNTFANRIEEHILKKLLPMKREQLSGWKPHPSQMPTLLTEKYNRAMSWGLMQVLGETARWCGRVTHPYLTALADPEIGIDTGCRVLSYYLGKSGGDYTNALSRYNSGSPAALSSQGAAYAQKVLSRVARGEHLQFIQPN